MTNTVCVIDEWTNTASYLPGKEMDTSYYLTAFIDEQGQRRPFSLKMEGPFAVPEGSDFYYRIESLELLGKDFNVHGDSKIQSKEQAFKFVEICLKDKKLYDAKGNILTFNLREKAVSSKTVA